MPPGRAAAPALCGKVDAHQHMELHGSPAAREACVTREQLHRDCSPGLVPGLRAWKAARRMCTRGRGAAETVLLTPCAAAPALLEASRGEYSSPGRVRNQTTSHEPLSQRVPEGFSVWGIRPTGLEGRQVASRRPRHREASEEEAGGLSSRMTELCGEEGGRALGRSGEGTWTEHHEPGGEGWRRLPR